MTTQAHVHRPGAPRPDPLTPIHKGLRRSFFETALTLSRTDFADPAETALAQEAVATCLEFLREHAEHEDRHMVPVIAKADPELAAIIEAAHPQLERMAIAIESLWPRLAPLDAAGRTTLGAELSRRFQGFVAEQLLHMDLEERRVLGVIWSSMSDVELAAMNARIVAAIPAPRMQAWGALLGPALNAPERAAMAPPSGNGA